MESDEILKELYKEYQLLELQGGVRARSKSVNRQSTTLTSTVIPNNVITASATYAEQTIDQIGPENIKSQDVFFISLGILILVVFVFYVVPYITETYNSLSTPLPSLTTSTYIETPEAYDLRLAQRPRPYSFYSGLVQGYTDAYIEGLLHDLKTFNWQKIVKRIELISTFIAIPALKLLFTYVAKLVNRILRAKKNIIGGFDQNLDVTSQNNDISLYGGADKTKLSRYRITSLLFAFGLFWGSREINVLLTEEFPNTTITNLIFTGNATRGIQNFKFNEMYPLYKARNEFYNVSDKIIPYIAESLNISEEQVNSTLFDYGIDLTFAKSSIMQTTKAVYFYLNKQILYVGLKKFVKSLNILQNQYIRKNLLYGQEVTEEYIAWVEKLNNYKNAAYKIQQELTGETIGKIFHDLNEGKNIFAKDNIKEITLEISMITLLGIIAKKTVITISTSLWDAGVLFVDLIRLSGSLFSIIKVVNVFQRNITQKEQANALVAKVKENVQVGLSKVSQNEYEKHKKEGTSAKLYDKILHKSMPDLSKQLEMMITVDSIKQEEPIIILTPSDAKKIEQNVEVLTDPFAIEIQQLQTVFSESYKKYFTSAIEMQPTLKQNTFEVQQLINSKLLEEKNKVLNDTVKLAFVKSLIKSQKDLVSTLLSLYD